MNKICFGCGSVLQSEDINKVGYIPQEKLNNSSYCQRCFRINHYGDYKEAKTPKSIDSIINNINDRAKYVLFLVDFITLNKDVIQVFKRINKPKMLIVGKCDIIPKSVRFELIIKSLRDSYNINDEIKFISSNTGYGINTLIDYLDALKIKEVYVLGETNVGKSSLINKMMDLMDSKLTRITTSKLNNTTLDFIRLKLSDNLTIIDSPGFVLFNNTIIKDMIKPKTYQMKKGETLFVDGEYFSFSENNSVTLYISNELEVRKVFKDIEYSDYIEVNDETDLIIKSEGFMNIKNKCQVKLSGLSIDDIELRKSIFGGYYE